MGKTHLSSLFILFATMAYSQTNISGGIYQNTSWSSSGNPYVASGNVVVFEDVTLNIEPGVIIKFNPGASLEVRGKLIAIGNAQDSIRFTSNLATPVVNSWKGVIVKGTNGNTGDGHQVTMEYCVGEYAGNFVDLNIAYEGPYVFRHCYFGHNLKTNDDGGIPETIFDQCKFEYNSLAVGSSGYTLNITNCEFVNNENGVGGADLVEGCHFSNHSNTAILANEVVRNCTIVNNNIGVDCSFYNANNVFVDNTIKYNDIGLRIQKFFIGSVNVTGNEICDNATYNLELLDFNNAVVPFNCWCSTDSAYIRSTINDGYKNTNFGLVYYMPLGDDCPEIQVGLDSKLYTVLSTPTIYPNPFTDELNVKNISVEDATLFIYTQTGQNILQQFLESNKSVGTEHIPAGIYFYEIKSKDLIIGSGKVVKAD